MTQTNQLGNRTAPTSLVAPSRPALSPTAGLPAEMALASSRVDVPLRVDSDLQHRVELDEALKPTANVCGTPSDSD